jgi:hypothetical protein
MNSISARALPALLIFVGSVASAGVISSGAITIPGTNTFDYDAGVLINTVAEDTFWDIISPGVEAMVPEDGAGIVNLGAVSFAALTVAQMQVLSYSTGPTGIDGSLLVPGDVFAVQTNAGNFAKVLVTGTLDTNNGLPIQWEIDSASAVPEPSTIAVSLLAIAALAWRHHRRYRFAE